MATTLTTTTTTGRDGRRDGISRSKGLRRAALTSCGILILASGCSTVTVLQPEHPKNSPIRQRNEVYVRDVVKRATRHNPALVRTDLTIDLVYSAKRWARIAHARNHAPSQDRQIIRVNMWDWNWKDQLKHRLLHQAGLAHDDARQARQFQAAVTKLADAKERNVHRLKVAAGYRLARTVAGNACSGCTPHRFAARPQEIYAASR